MKKLLFPLGIIFIILSAIWYWGIQSRYTERFPDGWEWQISFIGLTRWADENGNFPEGTTLKDDPINYSSRTIIASKTDAPEGAVQLTDHYITRDPTTNGVIWELTTQAMLDAESGKYLDPEFENDYFLFPRNTAKTTYHIRNSSYQGIPFEFQQEETIADLKTYVFTHTDDLNNQAAYPDMTLEEDQTVICFDFEMTYWVEPKTGEVVKYREWCEGDYIVNTATGERVIAIDRWGGESTGEDLVRRSDEIKTKLMQQNLMTLYIPALFLATGLILCGVGLFLSNRSGVA